MKKRMQYFFTGYVQGVGFRYRAYHSANLLGLTGWVRNEPDGSVSMEVQGDPDSIDRMLKMIQKSPFIEIDRCDSREIPLIPEESSFEISDV